MTVGAMEYTTPYPWPYHGQLDPWRTALVVAGAQPAWAERSLRAEAVATVISRVGAQLRGLGGHVVLVAHRAPGTAPARGPRPPLPPGAGSPAAGVLALAVEADLVVGCSGTSGFHGSPLDAELRHRGVELLVLAGFGYEAAVESTLRAANDRGYECLTLVDGVAPFDEHTGGHALSSITMSGGIFGAIGASGDLLAALGAHTAPVLATVAATTSPSAHSLEQLQP